MDAYCIGVYTFELPKKIMESENNILSEFLQKGNEIQIDVTYDLK